MLVTVLAFLRNAWRGLTSMRTALVLLFLLALAALPGALLPQRSLNAGEVDKYFREYPTLAPILDKLGAFEVFSSVGFASIYVLLFISLIGCLLPRSFEYLRQLRAKPVRTPRNLARMPHYRSATLPLSSEQTLSRARTRLRGWRRTEHDEGGGVRSISAERGYLREAGNLVFHFSLVALLVCVAGGKLYGYDGNVIVQADGSEFCNSGIYNYDSFHAGLNVDGTQLSPFCVRVNDFQARYLPTGQPVAFRADMQYQSGEALENNQWLPHPLQLNDPLRTAGDRVYLTGNGYSPRFTVIFPNGQRRTSVVQWQTVNPTSMLAQGATKFDPPGVTDERQRRKSQLAITGLFAPTANFQGGLLNSQFPDQLAPAVAVDVLRGDLGLDSGQGQSIFSVDQSMVDSGRLKRVERTNLRPGQEVQLNDGTRVRFDGAQRWVNLQISHDPFQQWVLVSAIAIILGIGTSLIIKRRRIWVRVRPQTPDDGSSAEEGSTASTVIEVGGLARTDQAGYGEEFTRLARDLLASGGDLPRSAGSRMATATRGRKS